MAKLPTTAAQFADSLHEAGCKITWVVPGIEFNAQRGRGAAERYVNVCFYRDGGGFHYAKCGLYQTLRSMSAVRRYLRLEAAKAGA